jgi:small subunit ribosomal protein S20
MLRNRINKTKVHNAVKKVRTDLAESPELAQKSLKSAMSVIHKAATKGTLHKKTAARRISRLASSIHKASLRLDAASTPSGEYLSENAPDQPAGE